MSDQTTPCRLRITFGKRDSLRFIGHLDLAKAWERVLRRARLPLVYSQGYNPQPKMQLASALPLGISSDCELMDIWLRERVPLGDLPERLNAVSPAGLVTFAVSEVPLQAPALQTLLRSAHYRIRVDEVNEDDLRQRLADLLAQTTIERERRGKTYDLRPLVFGLTPTGDHTFHAELSLGPRGTARPDELLETMGLAPNMARCHRFAIELQGGEERGN